MILRAAKNSCRKKSSDKRLQEVFIRMLYLEFIKDTLMRTTFKNLRVRRCPKCGGRAVRIIYGYPLPETFEAAERGELVLGGCCRLEGSPDGICDACGYKWLQRPGSEE
jgi:hypothetical protein